MTVFRKTKGRIVLRDRRGGDLVLSVEDDGEGSSILQSQVISGLGWPSETVWLTLEDAESLCRWMRRRIREVEKGRETT